MLVCEELEKVLNQIDTSTNLNLRSFFSNCWEGVDGNSAQYRILKLFEDAESEILIAPLIDRIRDRQLTIIANSRQSFFGALGSPDSNHFLIEFDLNEALERLRGLSDVLNSVGLPPRSPINRPSFLKSSLELCKEITLSKMPEYAKKTAVMKIESLNRIISDAERFSDEEIRLRVKAIYADFCAEFEEHDKGYENVREKISRWAKPIMRGGVFALSLTANVAGIAGYLEGPK